VLLGEFQIQIDLYCNLSKESCPMATLLEVLVAFSYARHSSIANWKNNLIYW